jgi:GAF domain-containing protein
VSHETFISQNVHEEDNYIACSVDVQSEIVVPIMKGDKFVAQIDIDSNTRGSITKEQGKLLESIAQLLASLF